MSSLSLYVYRIYLVSYPRSYPSLVWGDFALGRSQRAPPPNRNELENFTLSVRNLRVPSILRVDLSRVHRGSFHQGHQEGKAVIPQPNSSKSDCEGHRLCPTLIDLRAPHPPQTQTCSSSAERTKGTHTLCDPDTPRVSCFASFVAPTSEPTCLPPTQQPKQPNHANLRPEVPLQL